jgi:hypothetical protein
MNTRLTKQLAALLLALGISAGTVAQEKKEAKPPEFKLPPGWTEADMQAMAAAGTPGEQHKLLARDVGTWTGKATIWMSPGAEPIKHECTSTVTSILGGRYIRIEIVGEMPGMGPFHGLGTTGYDNVKKTFVASWIDSMSTGMMSGEGRLSPDGKVMTWTYNYSCPITLKPAVMREIHTWTGENTKTLESHATDPKSGKEYKMMVLELTRK